MKITKKGTPPGERIWKGRCHSCGSEAEAIPQSPTSGTRYVWDPDELIDQLKEFRDRLRKGEVTQPEEQENA